MGPRSDLGVQNGCGAGWNRAARAVRTPIDALIVHERGARWQRILLPHAFAEGNDSTLASVLFDVEALLGVSVFFLFLGE